MSELRILFVDDDPGVLSGLRRMLYRMRSSWQMDFVNGGQQAMEQMVLASYDLLVTDLRMPDVDGVKLLEWVQSAFPQTIRFVLSGQTDHSQLLQSMGLAHQFLAKPCDPEMLKMAIARAVKLRSLFTNPALQRTVVGMKGLPVIPSVVAELTAVMASPDGSLGDIGELISQDLGLTTRVLQIVNSPLFGLRQQVNDPHQAVVLLGMEKVSALVIATSTFDALSTQESATRAEALYAHAVRVGNCASKIAQDVGDAVAKEWALVSSLLHDVGKLIYQEAPQEHADLPTSKAEIAGTEETAPAQPKPVTVGTARSITREAILRRAGKMPPAKPQKSPSTSQVVKSTPFANSAGSASSASAAGNNTDGITHAQAGAYLLGLWGFTEEVVAAVAGHHTHPTISRPPLSLATTVYVANQVDHIEQLKEMEEMEELNPNGNLTENGSNILDFDPSFKNPSFKDDRIERHQNLLSLGFSAEQIDEWGESCRSNGAKSKTLQKRQR